MLQNPGESETPPGRAPAWRASLLGGLAVLAAAWLVTGLPVREASATFELGPNDHCCLSGFADHYEVEDGVGTRWTSYDATLDLPLVVEGGPVELELRGARVFPQTAQVELELAGTTVDRFAARGGAFVTRRVSLPALPPTPVSLRLKVQADEGRGLGMKLDRVRVGVSGDGRLRPRGRARWLPALLAVFLFLLLRLGGLSTPPALACGLVGVAGLGLAFKADLLGFTRALLTLAPLAIVLSAAACLFLRRLPLGHLALPVFVGGLLLKGALLFHPATFYPDVANARKYVETYRTTSGSLAERGVATQRATNVGFPRRLAGRDYALPYSPLYFLPLGLAATPGGVEVAVRGVGLAASALVALPLFWLASRVFSPVAGVLATLLWVFLPPPMSRLLLALHATLLGNLLDLLVIVAVFALLGAPASRRRWVAVGVATLASLLAYTSSFFSMTGFFLFVALRERRLALRLLGLLLAYGSFAVCWLYWPFLVALVTEILPAVARGSTSVAASAPTPAAPAADPLGALARVPLFYGYLYPALAAAGLALARRRAEPRAFRVLSAWGLAVLLMLALRAFGGGVFKDLKEITFAAPWVALLSAGALTALAGRGWKGRLLAILLTLALVAFGLGRFAGYLQLYAHPATGPAPWLSAAAGSS